VLSQYQRRADLVPNLVSTVKGFAEQEKTILLGVTNARARVGSIQATPELINSPVEAALGRESLLKEQRVEERAIDVFSQLRIWDTEHNNGLLIYLLLADHAVEIIADRGINEKVGAKQWELICRKMESDFKRADFRGGVLGGINAITAQLSQHFPAKLNSKNDLADAPMVLI
jgi:uncharacterized membrane protein